MTPRDMLKAIIQNSHDTALVLSAAKMQMSTDEQLEQRRNRVGSMVKQALVHRDVFPADVRVELEQSASETLTTVMETRNRMHQMRCSADEIAQIRALADQHTGGDVSKFAREMAQNLWENSTASILSAFDDCVQRTAGQSQTLRDKPLRIRVSDSESALLNLLAGRHTRGNVSWLIRAMVEMENRRGP